ncbi:Imm63 family immunity protein [Leptospira sp. GIMC2001]|uniref:Imm63 family immunity protein n=1 Tax=Leptospira sp. GIMC2001 TaxID=1513297 RepID=UPI00234A99BA|nr:Imm63 family immunity protein [Leptospira sp. GIMC2001]WCL51042.1 Imm63 family immunity protein [Leptospira sp. GIMC2001]
MKYSIQKIKKIVTKLSNRINASKNLLPTFGYSKDFAHPHIEVDVNGFMHFVVVERGHEIRRKTTKDLDELLYWIFEDITYAMSTNFELENRGENKDGRRKIFERQEYLLAKLNYRWKEIIREKNQNEVEKFPFDDLALLRALYCRQLRAEGKSELDINKLAYKKYPTGNNNDF